MYCNVSYLYIETKHNLRLPRWHYQRGDEYFNPLFTTFGPLYPSPPCFSNTVRSRVASLSIDLQYFYSTLSRYSMCIASQQQQPCAGRPPAPVSHRLGLVNPALNAPPPAPGLIADPAVGVQARQVPCREYCKLSGASPEVSCLQRLQARTPQRAQHGGRYRYCEV